MNIEQKKVTPKPGILVPLPDGNGYLPAEGKALVLTSYWYQREADGDVTIGDVEAAPPAPAAPAPAKQKSK